ncbi:enoyl-CoA hydratase/isomerase family protein [Sphingomonas sp. LT1P40]|uniref:enoyl-CoA hydratase/isomerase family protein n=1 Tax=Alteristakelama amylovorans TaxID=3096166 RepID=UPI002FCAFE4D
MIGWALQDHIAILTIDRGSARNAIPIAGWEALAVAAGEIAGSDARAVVLRSAMDGIFSAGADLNEFRQLVADPAMRRRFREAMAAGIEGVAALPMPVIAAVDGGCFGAAVALTLACDIVVAGDQAVFATTPAKLGLSYPAADVARLAARIGHANAAMMLFGGAPVNADAAFRIGLAQRRIEHALSVAWALAHGIAENVPEAVRALKCVLRDPAAEGHDRTFDDAFASEAFAERLEAFLGGAR